ncbi:MAG TPA: hypothetical protein VF407_08195 [Polyangiaceae bacterium]
MRFRLSLFALSTLVTFAAVASAQDVGKPAASTAPAAPGPAATAPGAPPAAASTTTDPAASGSASTPAVPPPSGAVGGFTYSDAKPKKSSGVAAGKTHAKATSHAGAAIATLPGFEMLPEGGSRLFVELTKTITVDERAVAGGVTYVLKGAHIAKRNNENALVTVHFNTPVTRARLLPSGGDLHFVVELRQNVKPTWKLVPAKDGASVLQIDFPSGTYLPNDAPAVSAPAAKPAASDAGSAKP